MGARMAGARTAAPVIGTKVAIPRRRTDTLRRQRLLDAIHHMIDRQLYLVVAPAGYGKTTLLVDFAADCEMPVCWYSLAPSDGEPAQFLNYLIASIQARFPRFGSETRRVMAQATDFRTDGLAVVAALINEVQRRIPDYFAVVLDDYHEVNESRAVNQLVDALLRYSPENFKLVISSRTMPRVQLSRLAALRQAGGLGRRDLCFTTDEVRDLMRDSYETVLPNRVVEELTARSEGWITGIILTTHTMWQGLFESMIRNAGQEQLYSYLASEVFARQTPKVQRFLLASSVLDDMEPAVAGALVGSSRPDGIFRQLEDGNLFVTELEGRKRVYRYHHLFRDFLRSRLDEGELGLSRLELEQRAGRLFQQRGQHEQAIEHLLAAGAFDDAASSIVAVAEETFNAGRLDTLAAWVDRLPEPARLAQPDIALCRARVAIQKGELQTAIQCCQAANEAAERSGDRLGAAEAQAQRAAALRLQGDYEQAISTSRAALALLPDEPSQTRAVACRTIGMAQWRLGDLHSAWTNLAEALRTFEAIGDQSAAAYVQIDLGAVAMYLGDLGEARYQLTRSATFWEKTGNVGRHGLALGNLGVVAYLEEQYQDAQRLLEAAITKAQAGLFPYAEAQAACSLGDVARDLGDYDRAEQLYNQALTVAEASGDQDECATALWSMANSYRQQGLYPRAAATLRRGMKLASGYRLAQLKLTAGICALDQGKLRRSGDLLSDAEEAFIAGGARYPRARALFHRALLRFYRSDLTGSDEKLTECLNMLDELGFAQFLSVDGRRCRPFIEQAARRGVGDQFLGELLRRMKRRPAEPERKVVRLAETQEAPVLQVRALGASEVWMDGRMIANKEWVGQSAKELFLYLLLHRKGVRRDQLMAAIAPESSQARANSQFHVAAFRLRRALYKDCLQFDGETYRLDPRLECEFDVEDFTSACRAAHAAEPGTDAEKEALEHAAALYGGRFSEGSYSEWVLQEQASLEEAYIGILSRLARLQLVHGSSDEAYRIVERALHVDNTLEELHEIAIRALISAGKVAEAQRHLNVYTAYMRDELGLEAPQLLRRLVREARSGRRLAAVG